MWNNQKQKKRKLFSFMSDFQTYHFKLYYQKVG